LYLDTERHTAEHTVDASNGATEEDVARGTRSDGKASTRGNKDEEAGSFNFTLIANQLQFVCRQLRNETKCLTLRYNTITFADDRECQAAQDCAVFLQTLPKNHARHLNSVVIQTSNLRERPSALQSIFDFCTEYPQSLVKYYLHPHCTRRDPLYYICFTLSVQYRFGKQFGIFDHGHPALQHICRSLVIPRFSTDGLTTRLAAPLNFRIFPEFCSLDEAQLRERINHTGSSSPQLNSTLFSDIDGGMEAFVACIREWHANGI